MEVRVLGPSSAFDDEGAPLALGGVKQRAVLAMLALRPNATLSVDAIAEGVWGEEVPERYVQNVQVYVSTLRRILEPNRARTMPSRIIGRGTGYELVVAPDEVDLLQFRALVAAGTAALDHDQPATAAAALRAALACWRGEPVEDLAFQPFAASATPALVQERWDALDRCLAAELAAGVGAELVAELEGAVAAQPLRERFWEHLVVALYRSGRQADALGALQRARTHLLDELGLEPGPDLRALEQQVLDQDPVLDPPRRAAARTARVPVPLSSLLGRDELVARIADALDAHRLVVLTGPGGVGKTRAALATVAARPADAGDAVFVDLTPARDAGEVLPLLAKAVGVSSDASPDDVADQLALRPTLLVVDNFEQVVEAAPALGAVLERAGSARALVTSRVRLGLPGEQLIEVEPLSTTPAGPARSPAAELFVARAIDVDARFDPLAYEPEIEAICAAVDGMPLAIELAASRVHTIGVAELVGRLDRALGGSARHAGSDRHRSMQAAVEWSVEMLTPAEQALFRALAVCERGVDLATVVAFGEGADLDAIAAEDALDMLVQSSLVRSVEAPGGRRFDFLAPIRAVARGSLASSERARIQALHARWFLARANHVTDDDHADARMLASVAADLPDIVAAIEWSAANGNADAAAATIASLFAPGIVHSSEFSTMRRLAEDVRHRAIGPDLAARLAVVVGAMAYVASDFATAAIELGAADHLPADDHVFRSRAAMSRAVLRADLGEHAGALAEAARAIDEARASGRARIIGLALGAASYTAFAAGDADLARQRAEERVAVEPPGHHGHVYALIDIAYSLLDLDQIDDARAKAADAFTAAQRLGNAQARAEACRCLAWCALIDGQPGGAAGQLLEQLAVFERTDGMIDRVIEVVLGAALVVALTGDASRAAELWRQGQQLHVNLGVAYGNWPRRLRELAAAHGLALALPPAEPTELRPVLRTTVDVLQAAVADMARS